MWAVLRLSKVVAALAATRPPWALEDKYNFSTMLMARLLSMAESISA